MPIGAIIFDPINNISSPGSSRVPKRAGWASIGGAVACRVEDVSQLRSDVIWLTNLNNSAFLSSKLPNNYRNENWLRTSFDQIAIELGLESQSEAQITAQALALVATRVIDYTIKKLGIELTGANRLNDEYGISMNLAPCEVQDFQYPIFDSIARQPTVSVSQTTRKKNRLAWVTILRCNRLAYARQMLHLQVPADTSWEMIKTRITHKDLERMELPFLARCELTDIKPLVVDAINWGNTQTTKREWLTDLEWRSVRKYATVSLREVLVCQAGYQSLSQYASMLPPGPADELSFSLGIVAEQIWTALLLKQMRQSGLHGYSARSAWVRSFDRMQMLSYAQRMSANHNVSVIGYGLGNVVVQVSNDTAINQLLDQSIQAGLLPPRRCFEIGKTGAHL